MKLYTYYRSQASFRVRIALSLKGIAREDSFLQLEKGDQFVDAYRAINPQSSRPRYRRFHGRRVSCSSGLDTSASRPFRKHLVILLQPRNGSIDKF
jgi:hypothetical protein